MKKLLQRDEHFYSLYEGLKVAEGIFDVLKGYHDDGNSKLALRHANTDEQLAKAKLALQTSINITRPLGITPANCNAEAKRILAHDVDLKALAAGLKTVDKVVRMAEARCKTGTLTLCDTAIEFDRNNTELVFTPKEYIAFAERALAEAGQKAESETLGPDFSILDAAVRESLPGWERNVFDRAFPLGELQDPAVREQVTRAKLVFGFDISKGLEGTIFFGRGYFKELVDRKARIPADEIVSFTFHSELEGHLKLAAAVQVLKGSCDVL